MNRNKFFLTISVPAIMILALISYNYYTLSFGEEILLKPAPVDPRDLFRGDYVALRYEISTINLKETPYDSNFSSRETVYAILTKGEKFWHINSISHKKPKLTEGEVCMKGTATSFYGNTLRVRWGIESYFVPEGKGKEIEIRNIEDFSIKVIVDSNCRALIKELYLKDEPIKFSES